MRSSPITGYVAVLRYYDRSGLLGAFGPYATEEDAVAGVAVLKQMPLRDGEFEIQPLFGAPGAPDLKAKPVYREGGPIRG